MQSSPGAAAACAIFPSLSTAMSATQSEMALASPNGGSCTKLALTASIKMVTEPITGPHCEDPALSCSCQHFNQHLKTIQAMHKAGPPPDLICKLTMVAGLMEEKTRAIATAPASLVSAARSAPTYPGVFAATAAKSKVPSSLSLLASTWHSQERPLQA